jgi:hypothetical protein
VHPRVVGSPQWGAAGPATRVWSCRSGCFGCAGRRRCTWRRITATRRRRWRWSRRARTCTLRATTGTVQPSDCLLVSLVCHSAGADGPSTRGVELQEWLLRLCRGTALQYASQNGMPSAIS